MPARMSKAEFARATGTRKPRKAVKPPALVQPSSSLVLIVTLPVVVVSEANQSSSRGGHWARRWRRQRDQKNHVWIALQGYAFPAWFNHATYAVTLTRLGGKAMDRHENLPVAFKGVVDEIAEWFGIKDNDPRVTWTYAQLPGTGPQGIEIRIEATEVQR